MESAVRLACCVCVYTWMERVHVFACGLMCAVETYLLLRTNGVARPCSFAACHRLLQHDLFRLAIGPPQPPLTRRPVSIPDSPLLRLAAARCCLLGGAVIAASWLHLQAIYRNAYMDVYTMQPGVKQDHYCLGSRRSRRMKPESHELHFTGSASYGLSDSGL
ncbi:hypothetical protein F5Y15DRAFT_357224 [Xylariaceae sp. FL0016]|nr:hypothetical protein F5Y15DRAFT_357224 [Xylariaceae sp. FL0016]